jgi:hypothetical protein
MKTTAQLNKARYKPIQLAFYCIMLLCTFIKSRVTKVM